jgi:hypothetical protein
MAVPNGADVVIKAENAPGSGVFVTVAALTRVSKKSDTDENTHPAFGNTKYVVPGTRNQGLTLSGFLDTTDTGQAALRTAESTRVPIRIQVLFDGVNGFDQSVRVRSFTHDADAAGDLQPVSFDVVGNAAATIVGSGPVW